MMQKIQGKDRWFGGVGLIMLLSAALLQGLARKTDWFGSWYSRTIYPLLVGTIGRFFGLFPFSAVEIGLYALIAGVLIYGILHRKKPLALITRTLFIIGSLLFVYTTNCGINYYAPAFSQASALTMRKSSTDELYELCKYLIQQARLSETDQSYEGNEKEWRAAGVASMEGLSEDFPALAGYYPRPKEVAVSRILSVQQLCGIYSPFSIEANFNGEMPDYNIPHTICHELSHLRGFMREDEANFIGYLACVNSENQAFRYSGYLTGWVYAGNALARADRERYMELTRMLSDQMREDLAENNAFWQQYEGKIAEVSTQMNDTYLKMNDQEDGVQSYGRFVDLMMGYYSGWQ